MKSNPHYAAPNQQSITVAEMIRAERAIVRVAQSQVFGDIISVLRNHEGFHDTVKLITKQQLHNNPSVRKLQTLNPYLVYRIIRVGGRLQRSTLSLEEKHPIILPNQHPVTELLVLMYHEREGHMGCSQVLTAMYKQYWILNGRSAVNNILKSCVKCRFWKTSPNQQQMGNFPADRVTTSTPFKVWELI